MNTKELKKMVKELREAHEQGVIQCKNAFWKGDACCAVGLVTLEVKEEQISPSTYLQKRLYGFDVWEIPSVAKEYNSLWNLMVSMNDSGKNFAEIADAVEKQFLQ